jgi:hypothetical protein
MPSARVLSTLSVEGWINQSIQVIDTMLSDFFLSEYSQTFAWPDMVSSFPWILQQYRDDIDRLVTETQQRLTLYMSTQFSDVEVQISHQLAEDSINKHYLRVFMQLRDTDGELLSLANLITHNDLKVTEINKILAGDE